MGGAVLALCFCQAYCQLPAGSTSSALHQGVSQADTVETLTSSLNPSHLGDAVTFTATLSSAIGPPHNGEQVTFLDGTSVLGTGTIVGGVARFTTTSLTHGIHTIKAQYAGDALHQQIQARLKQKVQ
jgi:hypothetical protein